LLRYAFPGQQADVTERVEAELQLWEGIRALWARALDREGEDIEVLWARVVMGETCEDYGTLEWQALARGQ